jgi:hypothetical protein
MVEKSDASKANAVLFNNAFPSNATPWHRPSNQVTENILLSLKIQSSNIILYIVVDFALP